MNLVINKLETITGWSGAITAALNQHADYIAHDNIASVCLTPDNDLNGKASLTLNQALTGYEYIVIDCVSLYEGVYKLSSPADAKYLIDFGFQKYHFPVPPKFGPIRFKISGTETITKIEITALHANRDVLMISHLQAIKEILPLDIVEGVVDAIALSEYSAGTATATAGAKTITVSSGRYIDRYARLRLGTKYYGVESVDGNTVRINNLYDGSSGIAENFSGAIYMAPPVESGNLYEEATIPSCVVWDDTPTPLDVDTRVEWRLDTYKYNSPSDDSVDVVEIGDNYALAIQIDCESQYEKVLQDMIKSVKKLIAKRMVWVNGVHLEINSLSIQREESEYEKMSFIFVVEYSEETWIESQKFPLSGTTTLAVNPISL